MHECHPCQKLATAAVCLVLHALVYVLGLTHLTHDVLCSKVCVLTVSGFVAKLNREPHYKRHHDLTLEIAMKFNYCNDH